MAIRMRLASRFGQYGYRQITNLLRIEGWQVNYKRVERIWRQEGLKVPRRQPKRGAGCGWAMARASGSGHCSRNHVWSYDFVSERTHDGRALTLLTVIDEQRSRARCSAARIPAYSCSGALDCGHDFHGHKPGNR